MSAIESAAAAQWSESRRWIAKAAEDRRAAFLVLADDPPLLDPAAYHCQQASEKLLKALLAATGEAIPRSHDLQRLAAMVTPLFPALAEIIGVVSTFTPWGTATRYPDLEPDIGLTAEDIRDAFIALDSLLAAIVGLDPTGAR